eukprot:TRINITY_DN56629_c0_g1_i1.p3 TRINITY_DN56629_c0_g1~~TRINITY_DN56629_c0_g1_i1.p3  ORF type:complete len:103 (-),score=2.23 TRINITY_DN56629_c0_g1_i1:824-1132(-)
MICIHQSQFRFVIVMVQIGKTEKNLRVFWLLFQCTLEAVFGFFEIIELFMGPTFVVQYLHIVGFGLQKAGISSYGFLVLSIIIKGIPFIGSAITTGHQKTGQ